MNAAGLRSVRTVLHKLATNRIARLQKLVLLDDSATVATLARLRRCDPSVVGAEPLVWEVTLGDLPEELTHFASGRPDDPTPAERALHAALVLYSHHQQSRDEGVHRPEISFGKAMGVLARARSVDEGLDRTTVARLHQAGLASDLSGHLHHLRGLVQLMRAERPTIGFDYGLFAVDLWQLADAYQDSTTVLARWGRDLHFQPTTKRDTTKETS